MSNWMTFTTAWKVVHLRWKLGVNKPEPSKPDSRRRTMDDWDQLQTICLYVIYMTIIVGFGLLIAFWIMA